MIHTTMHWKKKNRENYHFKLFVRAFLFSMALLYLVNACCKGPVREVGFSHGYMDQWRHAQLLKRLDAVTRQSYLSLVTVSLQSRRSMAQSFGLDQ